MSTPNEVSQSVDGDDSQKFPSKHVTFKVPGNEYKKQAQSDDSKCMDRNKKLNNSPKNEKVYKYQKNTTNDLQASKPERYKKGVNAKFIRQNPRYINEPICHVLSNEISSSVEDCLQWSSQAKSDLHEGLRNL